MTRQELKAAFKEANNPDYKRISYSEVIAQFEGFGLKDFQPINCTINQLANLINFQCKYLNGGYDMAALNEIEYFGKRNFKIL